MQKESVADKQKAGGKIEIIDSQDFKKRNPEKNLITDKMLERLVSKDQKVDLILKRETDNLEESYVLLLLASPESYAPIKSGVLRLFDGKKGLYITLNKPFSSLMEEIDSRALKYDGAFFIDLISKTTNSKILKDRRVGYLESAADLTELVLFVEKKLNSLGRGSFVVFDSVSTLLVYNEPNEVERLIHVLSGKANSFGAKFILLMVESKEHEGTIETLGQFCSKVAKIEKIEI